MPSLWKLKEQGRKALDKLSPKAPLLVVALFITGMATIERPNRLPPIAIAESFQMPLTVAHISPIISPIISLIAGVLILIMPRFLNFIVALFLILNGLLGLGLLKWLHL